MDPSNGHYGSLQRGSSYEGATRRFAPRSEPTRERDALRHLLPWSEVHKPNFLNPSPFSYDSSQSLPQPEPCTDTALLAFAQLATVRLNARRSFVTLLTTHTEYVLAEATRTMSFQNASVKNEKDRPLIGTCSFPRDDGLTSRAMRTWGSARSGRDTPPAPDHYYTGGISPHWHIINDLRQDAQFQAGPAAKHIQSSRFYLAVPLRGSQGSVIGSFIIIDDRPRYGIDVDEMNFMEDLADTITQHLHATVVRSQRQRSERLIQALGLFNHGKSSLRDWWLGQEDARLRNIGRHAENVVSPMQREALGDAEFGYRFKSSSPDKQDGVQGKDEVSHMAQAKNQRSAEEHSGPSQTTQILSDDDPPKKSQGREPRPAASTQGSSRSQRHGSQSNPFDLARAIAKTYNRACNLLREALGAHGVAFVDAQGVARQLKRSDHSDIRTSHVDDEATRKHESSDTELSEEHLSSNSTCTVHGISVRNEDAEESASTLFTMPESYLQHLIKRFPKGHVFNFEEGGQICWSSGDDDGLWSGSEEAQPRRKIGPKHGQGLRSIMREARTVAFFPLWDEISDRWRSGLFVWSTAPFRVFDEQEDLTYLSAFGHSLVAELSRLETLAADEAKATFISSISHELRSPLHGILAGVEFLQESNLSSFQQEMAHTVRHAGRTLLDTVNHLLDYSKISSFSPAQRRRRVKADTARHHAAYDGDTEEIGVTSNVDLAQLTEELVETVVSAHRFQYSSLEENPGASSSNARVDLSEEDEPSRRLFMVGDVSITVNIEWSAVWVVEIQPGSWTRIVTNLVGNALKYTRKGSISVSLHVEEPSNSTSAQPRLVQLVVEDTGPGISQSFLKNYLYIPFKQENSHSAGTGLGLSIVKRIADDLGANLRFTSHVGKGTKVEVSFRPKFAPTSASEPRITPQSRQTRRSGLDQLQLIEPPERSAEGLTSSAGAVRASVLQSCEEWLDCKVVCGLEMPESRKASVYAILEDDIVALSQTNVPRISDMLNRVGSQRTRLLVLSCSVSALRSAMDQHLVNAIFVHQPIGPQKLVRAVAYAQDSATALQSPRRDSNENMLSSGQIERRGSSFLSGEKRSSSSSIIPRVPVMPQSPRRRTDNTKYEFSDRSSLRGSTSMSSINNVTEEGSEQLSDATSAQQVLLVEDNEINMKLLVALMKKVELRYQCASNGREALDLFCASPSSFFLILMDISMPVMDGVASTAAIREFEKSQNLQRTMIAALTGVTNDESIKRAYVSGVDEYHTKPVDLDSLKRLLDRARKGIT